MQITPIPSGPLETNCFLLDNGKGEALVIDAPPEGFDNVASLVKRSGSTLKAVLITHGHFDHILDARRYKEQGIPLVIHGDSVAMTEDPAGHMPFTLPGLDGVKFKLDGKDIILDDHVLKDNRNPLGWDGWDMEIFSAPGHCPGSLVFHFPSEQAAFTGDVIFYRSVGRTDLPGGSMDRLLRSIKETVYLLPGETKLFPGHGPSTSVDDEKRLNPYT